MPDTRPRLVVLAGVLAALLGAALASATGAGTSRFALAVVRRDGRLIPFASYDNGRWHNSWPTTVRRSEEIPLTLANVPAPYWPWKEPLLTWRAWPLDGPPRSVSVAGPVLFASACSQVLGLTSSYQPFAAALPPYPDPFPKDGLATAGDVTIEPIDTLTAESPDWAVVARAIRSEVNESEGKSAEGPGYGHPARHLRRLITPVTLEVLCRTRDERLGRSIYYFEGVKRYKGTSRVNAGIRQDCDFLTYFTGWLVVEKGRAGKAVVSTALTECLRDGVLYTLPLGQITIGGQALWIVQVSGRGFEQYQVVEPRMGKVKQQLVTSGGICR